MNDENETHHDEFPEHAELSLGDTSPIPPNETVNDYHSVYDAYPYYSDPFLFEEYPQRYLFEHFLLSLYRNSTDMPGPSNAPPPEDLTPFYQLYPLDSYEPFQSHPLGSYDPFQSHYLSHPLDNYDPFLSYPFDSYEPFQSHPLDSYEPFQSHTLGSDQPFQSHPLGSNEPFQSQEWIDIERSPSLHGFLVRIRVSLLNEIDLSQNEGLGYQTITQNIRRESFQLVVDEGNPDYKEQCAICLEDYEDGEEVARLDLCIHMFHVPCITEWLRQKNVCPICKQTALTVNVFEG
ncbi:hypothetical protein Fmac_014744 [Flemingia macrophylla]|uniref:RING-type E3 ubiquitin transferase n=1 Tax=Flemingia macrophylla TaxID=520843 RepID=A0ABD1MCK6_9FABA